MGAVVVGFYATGGVGSVDVKGVEISADKGEGGEVLRELDQLGSFVGKEASVEISGLPIFIWVREMIDLI